jgi:hypothetical protein
MPDVLGGMLSRQQASAPTTLGSIEKAFSLLSPYNIAFSGAKSLAGGLLGGADLLRKLTEGEPVYPSETLGASSLGVVPGGLASGGSGTLGSGGGRLVQGSKGLVEDLKSGLLGAFASTKPKTIVKATKEAGAYSVNLLTGEKPTEGIMAGKYANTDPRTTVVTGLLSPSDVEAHVAKNEKVLSSPDHFFGTWTDPATGKTYLDVSKRFQPTEIRPATKFGEKTGQLSLYNVGTGEFPPVGSYPGFVSGANTPAGVVPYAQRLQEMGSAGQAYMAQFPGIDWWRQPNMERVYGTQIMPNVRGLLAATSTNNAPPPNVTQMSEYVRRLIAGEPIIQPDYRIPMTALGGRGGNPGSAMGLETGKGGRQFNLLVGARGETNPAAYHGDVVREKVMALGGDPAAIVLDRIQARLTEQPSAGIYAMPKEGQSPVGADRKLVLSVITQEAKKAGLNPDTFSGNVWAGIRENVKQTGELYGTPLPGVQAATRATESKSYDDLFMDRIKQKADHLGMSVGKFESKLRKGDVNLLSHFLAPTGAIGAGLLYSRNQGGVQPLPNNPTP